MEERKPVMEKKMNKEKSCPICEGTGWVCENHRNIAWAGMTGKTECCGGAGAPCECNPLNEKNSTFKCDDEEKKK